MRRILIFLATLFTALKGRPAELNQVEVVAAVLWAEARGEGPHGVCAVAEVIRNRTREPRRWGATAYEVVTQPKQFSCFNGVKASMLIAMAEHSTGADRFAWDYCLRVARELVLGTFSDDTMRGATHYHAEQGLPYWAASLDYVAQVGDHHFYK